MWSRSTSCSIKPGHPFDAPFHRLRGDLQPRGGEQIAQEVKPPADPTDEGLVGVLLELQLRQRLVHQPDLRGAVDHGNSFYQE